MITANNTAFLICTEKPIEIASVLLVQSIRDWGGSLANCPIYSFQPRPGFEISDWAKDCFKNLGVEHITEPLNTLYSDYPQGNKPLVCAYAEKHLCHEHYIFCDSDKLVVNDLAAGFNLGEKDIAVRPVHGKGKVGCTNKNDPAFKYWGGLWKELEISAPEVRVKTTIWEDDIYGYWNSGLIIVRSGSGVFEEWKRLFELTYKKRIEPAVSTFFLDQIVLAAALHTRPSKIQELPHGYNYPIHRHVLGDIPKDNTVTRAKDLYTVHYHGLIRDPFFINMFDTFEESKELKKWLHEQVSHYKIDPHFPTATRLYYQFRLIAYRLLKKRTLR